MNVQKSIAIVAALLITATGMAGIAHYGNAAAAATGDGVGAEVSPIQTLPAITVSPTREQLLELRGQ
ncbi:MAG: hypothetical protein ACREP0_02435 [Rhodanobacteraceae bacterium]